MHLDTELNLSEDLKQVILEAAAQAVVEDKVSTPHTVNVWLEHGEISFRVLGVSPITRIRRITGYLSKVENFNDAKKAELRGRKMHDLCSCSRGPVERMDDVTKTQNDCTWTREDTEKVLAPLKMP